MDKAYSSWWWVVDGVLGFAWLSGCCGIPPREQLVSRPVVSWVVGNTVKLLSVRLSLLNKRPRRATSFDQPLVWGKGMCRTEGLGWSPRWDVKGEPGVFLRWRQRTEHPRPFNRLCTDSLMREERAGVEEAGSWLGRVGRAWWGGRGRWDPVRCKGNLDWKQRWALCEVRTWSDCHMEMISLSMVRLSLHLHEARWMFGPGWWRAWASLESGYKTVQIIWSCYLRNNSIFIGSHIYPFIIIYRYTVDSFIKLVS